MKIGIDFGTTNSAVAALHQDGRPRILELFPGERMQRTVIHASTEGRITFGNAAFRAYLESDLTGRFLRSIKAFLPQDVPRTQLARRWYSFPELVTAYLQFLVRAAEGVLGEAVTEVVVGRPVTFHADPEKNELALTRLQTAIAEAGLQRCTLQLEPVAAAYLYELSLSRERLVLVGDFGGGTSDFAVFRAGPGRVGASDRLADVLGTSGVAAAGDVLDGRFMDIFLMGAFGRGASIRSDATGELEPWEHPIQRQIQRLYSLHLLRTRELGEGLTWLEPRLSDPHVIRRIRRLVFDDLGYPMAWAIERSKRELSDEPETLFRFDEFYSDALDIRQPVDRASFARGCAEQLEQYDRAIDLALQRAGVGPEHIDDVFLTGGTSQLPFIRELFARRFGPDKLHGADSFTSVCEGLAVAAGR
jgi:hypothetical chaperone protein